MSVVDDDDIDAERFLDLLDVHTLGRGETESIVACEGLGFGLCCDDKRARALGEQLLGRGVVVGTIGVLRWCVAEQIVDCGMAFMIYNEMKARGGFLPDVPKREFCGVVKAV